MLRKWLDNQNTGNFAAFRTKSGCYIIDNQDYQNALKELAEQSTWNKIQTLLSHSWILAVAGSVIFGGTVANILSAIILKWMGY